MTCHLDPFRVLSAPAREARFPTPSLSNPATVRASRRRPGALCGRFADLVHAFPRFALGRSCGGDLLHYVPCLLDSDPETPTLPRDCADTCPNADATRLALPPRLRPPRPACGHLPLAIGSDGHKMIVLPQPSSACSSRAAACADDVVSALGAIAILVAWRLAARAVEAPASLLATSVSPILCCGVARPLTGPRVACHSTRAVRRRSAGGGPLVHIELLLGLRKLLTRADPTSTGTAASRAPSVASPAAMGLSEARSGEDQDCRGDPRPFGMSTTPRSEILNRPRQAQRS